MRWCALVLLSSLFGAGLSQDDSEPSLKVLMPLSTIFEVNENKAIYCEGKNIKEKIQWISPTGEEVENSRRLMVERKKDKNLAPLIFKGLEITDTGNWTCKSGSAEAVISIVVGERVNLDLTQESKEVEEGRSAKLNCVSKGNPTPVVQWYKDNTQIIPEEHHKKYSIATEPRDNNFYLEIRNLNHRDAAQYMCKLTQDTLHHFGTKNIDLSVIHKPILINMDTQEELPLETSKIEEVYAILNETKNITCSAKANPAPEYKWKRILPNTFETLLEDSNIFTAPDGTYSVLMLGVHSKGDLGQYKCSVHNEKGHDSIIYHVSFGNKPDPPDYAVFISSNSANITFNVSCSTCNLVMDEGIAPPPNNLTVIGYNIQLVPKAEGFIVPEWDNNLYDFGVDIEDPEVMSFDVGPLPNTTEFYGRVRSKNAAGYSEWFQIAGDIKTTDFATAHIASVTMTLLALLLTLCY